MTRFRQALLDELMTRVDDQDRRSFGAKEVANRTRYVSVRLLCAGLARARRKRPRRRAPVVWTDSVHPLARPYRHGQEVMHLGI